MMQPMQKVYISHAPADLEIALQLAKDLARDGLQTCGNHVVEGESKGYKKNFYESIAEVRGFVVLLTADSLVDEHVKRETNIAIENKIPIYPVNLTGEDDLKKLLSSEWRYWLSITQILTCSTAKETSKKLRFQIFADSATMMEEDLSLRASIVRSWRAFESIIEQIEIAKMDHTSIEFQELHSQFENEVVPGWTEISKHQNSPERLYKAESKFIGKMLFGLFNYLQYFDCHSLTIDRANSCGLKGHEIETLIDRYVKFSALSFEYPTSITWFAETQFLWNYQIFIELCPPLLNSEKFPEYSEVLTHDYESLYSNADIQGFSHMPQLALKTHIFDDLSKYVFYRNVVVLANENVPVSDLKLALSSVNIFLEEYGPDSADEGSAVTCREEFNWAGYPTLSLFRAYLLNLLGKEDEERNVIEEFKPSDVSLLNYSLIKSLSAANGVGSDILEQLWGYFQKRFKVDPTENELYEDYIYTPEERAFTVAEQLYILANRFQEAGDTETAMDLWARSARGGVFSGLASYTWSTLNIGAFDAGVALYEECSEIPCNKENLSEKLNCTGNYLLNILARDHDFAGAIKRFNALVLEEGKDTTFVNHMSLAILELHHGDPARATQVFRSIPTEAQVKINQAYFEQSTEVEGWLKIWCREAVIAINELTNDQT